MATQLTLESLNAQIVSLAEGERLCLYGVPEHIYHASEGFGSTVMKAATKTMAHAKAKIDKKWIPSYATQSAMLVGRAAHCMVLEPESYQSKFIGLPENILKRQGVKWETFKTQNSGKGILNHTEQNAVMEIANSVIDKVGEFFVGGDAEVSFWYREKNGLILKARIDYLKDGEINDLKTDKADTKNEFARKVKYDYDIQDALYCRVTGIDKFNFIGVGKSYPYLIFMSENGSTVRELANKKIDQALNDITYALDFGEWPGYSLDPVINELNHNELKYLGAA